MMSEDQEETEKYNRILRRIEAGELTFDDAAEIIQQMPGEKLSVSSIRKLLEWRTRPEVKERIEREKREALARQAKSHDHTAFRGLPAEFYAGADVIEPLTRERLAAIERNPPPWARVVGEEDGRLLDGPRPDQSDRDQPAPRLMPKPRRQA